MFEKIRSKTFLILMKIIEAQIQETPEFHPEYPKETSDELDFT